MQIYDSAIYPGTIRSPSSSWRPLWLLHSWTSSRPPSWWFVWKWDCKVSLGSDPPARHCLPSPASPGEKGTPRPRWSSGNRASHHPHHSLALKFIASCWHRKRWDSSDNLDLSALLHLRYCILWHAYLVLIGLNCYTVTMTARSLQY